MAPFDNPYSSDLTTKLSPLIEGQVPDFIQADHPLFVKFLKYYYEYLEAGELRVTVNIDNLLLELETPSSVLDVDGNEFEILRGSKKILKNHTLKALIVEINLKSKNYNKISKLLKQYGFFQANYLSHEKIISNVIFERN